MKCYERVPGDRCSTLLSLGIATIRLHAVTRTINLYTIELFIGYYCRGGPPWPPGVESISLLTDLIDRGAKIEFHDSSTDLLRENLRFLTTHCAYSKHCRRFIAASRLEFYGHLFLVLDQFNRQFVFHIEEAPGRATRRTPID